MLPVAFEALSIKTPHSGKPASPKSDPGSSPQFAEMIDEPDTTQAQTGGAAPNLTSVSPDGDKPASSLSKGITTLTTVKNGQHLVSLSLPADPAGETSEPEGQLFHREATQDKAAKPVKRGLNLESITADGAPSGDALGAAGDHDDTDTKIAVTTTGLPNVSVSDPAPPHPATQSSDHGDKATKDTSDLDTTASLDQADGGAQTAVTLTASQPTSPGAIAVVDPATTASVADQTAPRSATSSKLSPAAVALGKLADASPEIATNKPELGNQSLGDTKDLRPGDAANSTPPPTELALADLQPDADSEVPAGLLALPLTPQPHAKAANTGVSIKLDGQTSTHPDGSSTKADTAAVSENPALTEQSQPAAAAIDARPMPGAEIDPQKSPTQAHDSLPQDSSPSAKSASALVPSSAFTLNGINVQLAAPAGTIHDPNATLAVAGAPQSAPAALVPVSGIAVEIASKALTGKNRFEIRLDPPELGRIHVRLDVDRSGEISSHVVVDRSDTLDLLRRDAPSLERALQDAGLKTSNNGLQFSLRDHGGFTRQEQPIPMPTNTRLIVADETLPAESTPLVYRNLAGLRSGLDIRV